MLCCVVLAAKGLRAQGRLLSPHQIMEALCASREASSCIAIVMEALSRAAPCVGMKCFSHANRHDTKFVFQEPSKKHRSMHMSWGILAFVTRE